MFVKQGEEFGHIPFKTLERLDLERRSRRRSKRGAFPVFIELLSRAVDRVLLGVQQMLDEEDHFDLATRIDPVPAAILRWIQQFELALPVSQDMWLEICE